MSLSAISKSCRTIFTDTILFVGVLTDSQLAFTQATSQSESSLTGPSAYLDRLDTVIPTTYPLLVITRPCLLIWTMAVLSAVLQIVLNTKHVPNPRLFATAFSKRFVQFGVSNPIAVMLPKIYRVTELKSFLSLEDSPIAFMKKLIRD